VLYVTIRHFKERDRQFDKVVNLTRELKDKIEECDTLRHTVNELTCRCRNIEQELSLKTDQNVSLTQQLKEKEELLSKFTHRMVAEHALVHEQVLYCRSILTCTARIAGYSHY
jgi:ABC-type phosphate transport system auxiliary subunit